MNEYKLDNFETKIECHCPVCNEEVIENEVLNKKFWFCPKCRVEVTTPSLKWDTVEHDGLCTCINCSWM